MFYHKTVIVYTHVSRIRFKTRRLPYDHAKSIMARGVIFASPDTTNPLTTVYCNLATSSFLPEDYAEANNCDLLAMKASQ